MKNIWKHYTRTTGFQRVETILFPPQQCKVDGHSMSVLRISEMQSCAGRFLGPHASENAIQIVNVDTADGPHPHAAECHDALMPIQMWQYCMQHTIAATQKPKSGGCNTRQFPDFFLQYKTLTFCNNKSCFGFRCGHGVHSMGRASLFAASTFHRKAIEVEPTDEGALHSGIFYLKNTRDTQALCISRMLYIVCFI